MIPKSTTAWQQAMQTAITDPHELLELLGLRAQDLGLAESVLRQFPMRVPRSYASQMSKGNPRDPLLLQVLPQAAEALSAPGYITDPVGDLASERIPGLLHKYPGRVLLITTGACAVHCRYCFRREFPYAEQNAGRHAWQDALQLIRNDSSIEEVILSGGDPLSLSDSRLAALSDELNAVPHLKRLRIHSRQPIVLPERVDEPLLHWLRKGRLRKVMVLHTNHAHELGPAVTMGLEKLKDTGVTLLNQSVLLRDINDRADVLSDLSKRLFDNGVIPYYLHQLDRVEGAAHFEVSDERALTLHKKLQDTLPGYMVPKLVREIPGELSKTALNTIRKSNDEHE